MSVIDPGTRVSGRIAGPQAEAAYGRGDGAGDGWVVFATVMIAMNGILNVIYGIAAIGNSSFFVSDTEYIISDLKTWGWAALILGVLQLLACASIVREGQFGRWFGVIAASLSAITALLSIPAYPFWSLAIFAIDIMIIYGLTTYGGRRRANGGVSAGAP